MEDLNATVANEVLQAMRKRQQDYENRHVLAQTPEQIEFTRAYWDKVFSTQQKGRAQLIMSRSTAHEMPFDVARKVFWGILQMRAASIEIHEDVEFNWWFTDQQKETVRNLVMYFINDRACQWPLTKGLFIYGAPGTGKTELMASLSELCYRNVPQLTKYFKLCSLSEIHVKAKTNKEYDPIAPNVEGDKCFDEFGRYTGSIMRFGDQLDINEAIIEQRYERYKRYGQLTHFIANATPNELEGSFTPMVYDRLREMCTSVHFTGQSKRHGTNKT